MKEITDGEGGKNNEVFLVFYNIVLCLAPFLSIT